MPVFQCVYHVLQAVDFGLQRSDVLGGQPFDFSAGALRVAFQLQQRFNLRQREIHVAGVPDKAQVFQILFGIATVARFAASGGPDKADFFVVANHFAAQAAAFRHFADVHPVPFFSDGLTKPRVKHKAVLRDIKEAV